MTGEPARRAAILACPSLIAQRRWRITSKVTGSTVPAARPERVAAAVIALASRSVVARVVGRPQAQRPEPLDRGPEPVRDDHAVSHALHDCRATNDVARSQGRAVEHRGRHEPVWGEVGETLPPHRLRAVAALELVRGQGRGVHLPGTRDLFEFEAETGAGEPRAP